MRFSINKLRETLILGEGKRKPVTMKEACINHWLMH